MEMRPPSKNLQAVDESLAFERRASYLPGTRQSRENHFGSIAGAQAELVFLFSGAKTGHSLFDNKCRNAVGVFCRGR